MNTLEHDKQQVRHYWENIPCGTWTTQSEVGSAQYFDEMDRARYALEYYIPDFAEFERWRGTKVLEVGFGQGTDMVRFARAGALYTGIDLTGIGHEIARKRLEVCGVAAALHVGDAENLPFDDDSFDLVYSFGVIHHTPDTPKAAKELIRVCKPGGQVRAMIYNRRSLFALQAYLAYGLLRGRPLRRLTDIFASHIESPGTKAYTRREAKELFRGLSPLAVRSVVTPYDLRVGRRRFLPRWTHRLVLPCFGINMLITGTKP